jgi:hypothetical protein
VEILDPGHKYSLFSLDGRLTQYLQFVKREGEGYPGNKGTYPGTNMQDVLRCLIDRAKYVDGQIPDWHTRQGIFNLREAIFNFEIRAARRHGRNFYDTMKSEAMAIELRPYCLKCGHIGCKGECHADK